MLEHQKVGNRFVHCRWQQGVPWIKKSSRAVENVVWQPWWEGWDRPHRQDTAQNVGEGECVSPPFVTGKGKRAVFKRKLTDQESYQETKPRRSEGGGNSEGGNPGKRRKRKKKF